MNLTQTLRPWTEDPVVMLDLLCAAWGFCDDEFEQILQVKPGWLRELRNHEVSIDEPIASRLTRLLRFHEALRMGVAPNSYARAWRRRWAPSSPIGHRSPWQAYQADGDVVLDRMQQFFLAQG